MSWFGHLRVQIKIMIAVGVVAALSLGVGVLSTIALRSLNDATLEITTNWLPSVVVVQNLNTNTSDFRIAEYRHVSSLTPEAMQAATTQIQAQNDLIAKNRKTYEPLISSAQEQGVYDTFSGLWEQYLRTPRPGDRAVQQEQERRGPGPAPG